jgi:hypothetical protein
MSIREKARKHVVFTSPRRSFFIVESGTSGELYKVTKGTFSTYCDCRYGAENPGKRCSHTIAVTNYVGRRNVVDSLDEPEERPTHSVEVRPDGAIVVTYK